MTVLEVLLIGNDRVVHNLGKAHATARHALQIAPNSNGVSARAFLGLSIIVAEYSFCSSTTRRKISPRVPTSSRWIGWKVFPWSQPIRRLVTMSIEPEREGANAIRRQKMSSRFPLTNNLGSFSSNAGSAATLFMYEVLTTGAYIDG